MRTPGSMRFNDCYKIPLNSLSIQYYWQVNVILAIKVIGTERGKLVLAAKSITFGAIII